jgi:hypothetical protein
MNISNLFTTSWESGEIVMRSIDTKNELKSGILERYTEIYPNLQNQESTEVALHLLDSVHTLLVKGKNTYINQPIDCDTSVLMASFHYTLRSSDGTFKSHMDRTKKIRIGKNKTQKVISEIQDTFTNIISEYEELYSFEGEFTLYDITIRLTPIQFTNKICLNRQTRLNKQRTGGSSSYAELPIVLKRLKCLLNIKNNDNMCLVWCILAYKFPKTINGTRVSVYKQHLNELNFKNLDFPACLRDVDILVSFKYYYYYYRPMQML